MEHCAYLVLDSICATLSTNVYMYKHMGSIPDRQFSSCKLMTLDMSHYIESYVNSHIGFDPNYDCHFKNGTCFQWDSYQSNGLANCRYRTRNQKRAILCLFDVAKPCASREQKGFCFSMFLDGTAAIFCFFLYL